MLVFFAVLLKNEVEQLFIDLFCMYPNDLCTHGLIRLNTLSYGKILMPYKWSHGCLIHWKQGRYYRKRISQKVA